MRSAKPGTWLGGVSGLVFVALSVAGGAIFSGVDVDPTSSGSTILAAFADQEGEMEAASLLTLAAVAFFLPFIGHLRRHFMMAEGRPGWLAATVYGGGLVLSGVLIMAATLNLAATTSVEASDPQVAKTVFSLQWNLAWAFAPPLIVLSGAAAAVILRYRALPLWMGWLAVAVAVASLAPWLGIFVLLPWVLVASLGLLLGASRPEVALSPARL